MNPVHEEMLNYFQYSHLPPALAARSKPFAELAQTIVDDEELNPREATVALRKLLESKDAAVRAAL